MYRLQPYRRMRKIVKIGNKKFSRWTPGGSHIARTDVTLHVRIQLTRTKELQLTRTKERLVNTH